MCIRATSYRSASSGPPPFRIVTPHGNRPRKTFSLYLSTRFPRVARFLRPQAISRRAPSLLPPTLVEPHSAKRREMKLFDQRWQQEQMFMCRRERIIRRLIRFRLTCSGTPGNPFNSAEVVKGRCYVTAGQNYLEVVRNITRPLEHNRVRMHDASLLLTQASTGHFFYRPLWQRVCCGHS